MKDTILKAFEDWLKLCEKEGEKSEIMAYLLIRMGASITKGCCGVEHWEDVARSLLEEAISDE
jgi:hypothetical protein